MPRMPYAHRPDRPLAVHALLCLILATGAGWLPAGEARAAAQQAAPAAQTTVYLPLVAQGGTRQSPDGLWQDVDEASLAAAQPLRQIVPQAYRSVALDAGAAQRALAAAPDESAARARGPNTISLPMPDGRYEWFTLVASPVMAPGLAAKFPAITTYAGKGIDDPAATVRLDWTPQGFHALVLSPRGTVYIDPYSKADARHYISYYATDFVPSAADITRELVLANSEAPVAEPAPTPQVASGSQLRTYRLAVAASGEYTQFHGGTVQLALAAIVTSINRVDGIYEREVAVRLVLVANNDQIIYTDATSDPYNNDDKDGGVNQGNVDSVIGSANYDIGHVFNTNGGGLASLGCVCTGAKAQGITGSGNPVGDPFDVDYVAHEMGHQFGANHTFNGENSGQDNDGNYTNSCNPATRNPGTAYEPGSGSTIMAYAGICGSDNLQPNSDPFFHGISLDEIVAFTTSGAGSTCGVAASSGNGIPSANAGPDVTIPTGTPFTLTGSGGDPDGDALTYAWEEFDLGGGGPPNNASSPPYFRSFSPTASPARTLPRLANIIAGTQSQGEALPSVGGTLTFRLTVRDNRLGGGGINDDTMLVHVAAGAGPFVITAPNTAETWRAGDARTVAWNVANTNAPPVACAAVDILLSTDGGLTYPTVLAAGVPNSGLATIAVPNAPTTQARIKVVCATGVFFDISNVSFTITPRASAGGPYTTNEGSDIALDASGSSLSDLYEWDFDNDGLFDDASGINPTFALVGRDGVYPVAVRVTKNGASDVATSSVTVSNVAPSVTFVSDSPRAEGSLLTVSGAVADAGWLDPLSGTVAWGDGLPAEPLVGALENTRPNATLLFNAAHVYADNGLYTVQVCGTDDDAATVCASTVVEVTNVPATVDAGQDQLVYEGDSVVLDPATFNDPGTLDTHTSLIDWGDGSAPTPGAVAEAPFGPPGSTAGANGSVSGEHRYGGKPGVYIVTVSVTDDDGGVGTDTLRVAVVPGFLRLCAFADEAQSAGSTRLALLAKRATLECAEVPGGAPGKTRPGGVGSRGNLEAEDNAVIAGDLLSLSKDIVLKGDSTLAGSVTAGRDVELEDNARASGSVTAGRTATLKGGSAVAGDVTAGAAVVRSADSTVGGTTSAGAAVPPPGAISTVQLALSAGAQRVVVAGSQTLAPGSYGELDVRAGATLTLRSGQYAFRKIAVGRGASVAFDLAAGPVVIDVVGDVVFQREGRMAVVSPTGSAADILFRITGGAVTLGEEGAYLGTFLALKAKATLGQRATLTGALYGKEVEIRERTRVVGQPAAAVFASLLPAP